MRQLILALVFTVAACTDKPETSYPLVLEKAKLLDFDYKLCSAVLLADNIADQTIPSSDQILISVFGRDPPSETLASLANMSVAVKPKLSVNPSVSSGGKSWEYNVSFIQKQLLGGYRAGVSYYCSPLCAGSTEYRLEKNGNSCAIKSKKLLWVS